MSVPDQPSAYPAFPRIPYAADARVSPVMTHCLSCDRALPPASSTGDARGFLILFTHCACGKVYMLDMARFQ